MAGRIQAQLVAALFCAGIALPGALALNASGILVEYSFDDDNIETGPDTFAVYEASKGTVQLSSEYRYSGYQSVEIRDVADDQDFPELQGYFPLRKQGMLYAHFALLVTNPDEILNIALAGPKWFSNQKDGIAFRLSTRDGVLRHHSDSIPKKLFPLEAFTWYVVDVEYNISEGNYNLLIREEGNPQAIVNLTEQANASSSPGSAVDKFSFIGDTGRDVSNTLYYVDDIVIGVDDNIVRQPFVAPGRRKYFFDMWLDFQKKAKAYPACLPAMNLNEFGITAQDFPRFSNEKTQAALGEVLSGSRDKYSSNQVNDSDALRIVNAISAWNRGCQHLSSRKPELAQEEFNQALGAAPESVLYRLSRALATGAAGNATQAETEVATLYSTWGFDPRMAVALSMIALANGDAYKSEAELRQILETPGFTEDMTLNLNRGPVSSEYTADLGSGFPLQWRQGMHSLLVSEQYFMVLLWQGKHKEALDFAFNKAINTKQGSWLQPLWYERAGDAAYLSGEHISAVNLYETSLNIDPHRSTVVGKLSDLYFQVGDLKKERELRERIYGTLRVTTLWNPLASS